MRPAPDGYEWVKDYDEAVAAWLSGGTPNVASLDHDLWGFSPYISGVRELNGADFVRWLCGDNPEVEDSGRWPHESLSIHTDFSGGRENMADMIEKYGPYDHRDTYDRTYPIPDTGYGYRGIVNVYGYTYTKGE